MPFKKFKAFSGIETMQIAFNFKQKRILTESTWDAS